MGRVSSADLVGLLKKQKFKLLGKREKYLVLRKGAIQIIIPNEEELAPNIVHTILAQAQLDRSVLKELHREEVVSEAKINKAGTRPRKRRENMGFFGEAYETEGRIFTLGVYRLVIGVLFLLSALSKAPWSDFGWFGAAVQNAIDYPTLGFLGSFFANTVQPNLAVFGWLVFLIELFLGLSLILGLFVVGSGFVGQFWVLLIWMTVASWPTEWAWSYIMLLFSMIMFWTMKAGRTLGIDQTLVDKSEAYAEHSAVWAMIRWLV